MSRVDGPSEKLFPYNAGPFLALVFALEAGDFPSQSVCTEALRCIASFFSFFGTFFSLHESGRSSFP